MLQEKVLATILTVIFAVYLSYYMYEMVKYQLLTGYLFYKSGDMLSKCSNHQLAANYIM